jgi:hypothetical protein
MMGQLMVISYKWKMMGNAGSNMFQKTLSNERGLTGKMIEA